MTEAAYRTPDIEKAIPILEHLVSYLKAKARIGAPEYAINDGVWVNKMRLAGAFYAKGDKSHALELPTTQESDCSE